MIVECVDYDFVGAALKRHHFWENGNTMHLM